MTETFAAVLKGLIDKKFKSARAFLRAVYPVSKINGRSAYLSLVLDGERPPSMEDLDGWADALGLKGAGRQQFLDLAREDLVSRTPEAVQALVKSMRSEITDLRKEAADLRAQASEIPQLRTDLAELRTQLDNILTKKPKVRRDG